MPLQVSRLRRWFAVGAISATAIVAGAYFYSRSRVQNALKEVPGKIGLEIQQSARGFTVSKSEQGHTLFTIQASKAVQFKQGNHVELHNVEITLYGSDSSRFDQVYGSEFEYDPRSGNVVAKGTVQIDLESNPSGLSSPDQTPPKELKNPIHVTTSGLTFNEKTGNASTKEKVEFQVPQARGSAVGADYIARERSLLLHSQVHVVLDGPSAATITAQSGVITKDPHTVVLEHPHLQDGAHSGQADHGTMFLRADNTLDRIEAQGNVFLQEQGAQTLQTHSNQAELLMAVRNGEDVVQTAILTGAVHVESAGPQPMEGQAGRAVLNFSGKNLLQTIHAEQDVHMVQHQKAKSGSNGAQDLELQAAAVDFRVSSGRLLEYADTPGAARLLIHPVAPAAAGQLTIVTAGRLQAHFNRLGRLASLHGAPDARIVNRSPGQPDRVSTSDTLDAVFNPTGGIDSIVQEGAVVYHDEQRKAWGGHARYTPADQILTLTVSPRVVDGGMTTVAHSMRLNRATGDAYADGSVETTYNDVKPEPNGALLASGSPIHVTASSMTAHRTTAVALYTGDVRLWQDANVVEAPSIEFDRDHRFVSAQASAQQRVSTVLVQTDKHGKVTPVQVTSDRLTYADAERKAHFEGGVVAKDALYTITSQQMDVYLQPRGPSASGQLPQDAGPQNSGPQNSGKIDHIVAQGEVLVTQPNRKVTGDRLVYTAADDKFVMTGNSPSIFDAEQGKITGVSLTFFQRDDRVLVEGNKPSPSVTKTRVAR
jgi:lipopolysaccharide export system protein LptA